MLSFLNKIVPYVNVILKNYSFTAYYNLTSKILIEYEGLGFVGMAN